jgi:hypothetical protein
MSSRRRDGSAAKRESRWAASAEDTVGRKVTMETLQAWSEEDRAAARRPKGARRPMPALGRRTMRGARPGLMELEAMIEYGTPVRHRFPICDF